MFMRSKTELIEKHGEEDNSLVLCTGIPKDIMAKKSKSIFSNNTVM